MDEALDELRADRTVDHLFHRYAVRHVPGLASRRRSIEPAASGTADPFRRPLRRGRGALATSTILDFDEFAQHE
jgi:hypothetical protein